MEVPLGFVSHLPIGKSHVLLTVAKDELLLKARRVHPDDLFGVHRQVCGEQDALLAHRLAILAYHHDLNRPFEAGRIDLAPQQLTLLLGLVTRAEATQRDQIDLAIELLLPAAPSGMRPLEGVA
jgi:hypothetical protein